MLKEEKSREDGAEETDRKGAGGKRAPKDPQATRGAGCVRGCFLHVCVCVCARVGVCWPHVPRQDAHGNKRLDPSKHLRPTDLIPPPDPTPAVSTATGRDVFRGLWGFFLNEPQKVSAWLVPVMKQRLQSFLFNSNFDKHALSRLTSPTGTRRAELRLSRNKTEEKRNQSPSPRQGMRRCFLLRFLGFQVIVWL